MKVSAGGLPEWGDASGGYQYEVKTTNFTAASGSAYLVDTSSAITATLPASPTAGDFLMIIDGSGSADSNKITVSRNGNTIMGLEDDLEIDYSETALELVYMDATNGWRITNLI